MSIAIRSSVSSTPCALVLPRYQDYEAQIYRLQRLLQNLEAQAHNDARGIDELRCAVELQSPCRVPCAMTGCEAAKWGAWLARWPDASLRRKGVMGNVLAFGHKTRGHIGRGLEVINETRQWLEQSEGYYARAWTAYVEAVLYLKRGSYFDARLACTRGLDFIERRLHGHPGQTGLLHALLAGNLL